MLKTKRVHVSRKNVYLKRKEKNNEGTTAYYFRKLEIMNIYRAWLTACGMYVVKWELSVIDLWIWDN